MVSLILRFDDTLCLSHRNFPKSASFRDRLASREPAEERWGRPAGRISPENPTASPAGQARTSGLRQKASPAALRPDAAALRRCGVPADFHE